MSTGSRLLLEAFERAQASSVSEWERLSLPTPSFYNETSLSSEEFDNLLLALGREALRKNMRGKSAWFFFANFPYARWVSWVYQQFITAFLQTATFKKITTAIETQRNRLRKEKEAANLLLAERDTSEQISALHKLRELQAQCKDLNELFGIKTECDGRRNEEDFVREKVTVRLK